MKDKIAEIEKQLCICGPEYTDRGLISPYCRSHEFAADVRDFLENIRVEVECPKCRGAKVFTMTIMGGRENIYSCLACQRTGKITRPATPEEMKIGGILRKVKG